MRFLQVKNFFDTLLIIFLERASCTLVCFEDLQCLYLFGGTGHNPQNLAKSFFDFEKINYLLFF